MTVGFGRFLQSRQISPWFSCQAGPASLPRPSASASGDHISHPAPGMKECQQKSRGGYELIGDCNDDISLSLVLTNSDSIENQFDPLMDMVNIFISRPF